MMRDDRQTDVAASCDADLTRSTIELDGKCCPEDFAISKKTSVKYVLYFVELCLCCSRGVSLHMCMLHSAIVASMHACMLHSAIVAIACILSSALFSSQEVHVALAQQSYQLPELN